MLRIARRALLLAVVAGCSTPPEPRKTAPAPQAWTPFNDPANRHHPERAQTLDVEKYTLRIKIHDTEPRTEGRIEIALRPIETTRTIALDAADMTIRSVRSGDRDLAFRHERETLSISLDREAKKGEPLALAIQWEGRPTRGLFWVRPDEGYPRRPAMVWSQGETEYNHYWFPCYDTPNDRALSESHFTVPSKYAVVSNGALVGVKDEGNGWSTHHWRMDVDHVSYLLSVVVGELEKFEDTPVGDVAVQYFVPRGQFERDDVTRSFAETPAMIRFFSERTGAPYPYPKYAQTVAWDFIWGGMENISATTLYPGVVTPKRAAVDGDAEGLIAHELAHQWFGDLITCRSWAHIWLNEGFATYFEALWQEHRHGKDRMMEGLGGGAQGYFDEDKDYRRPVVCDVYTDALDMFDSHTYPRGAWVLHMLRRLVGDEAWWKGIRIYVKRRARGLVETKDFRAAMEEASGQKLEWFFDQWLSRMGYPEFKVAQFWDATGKTLNVFVEQTQTPVEREFGPLKTGTPEVFRVPVEIGITTTDADKTFRVWIDQRRQNFTFPLESEPRLVAFDRGGDVLKKVDFKKTVPQLLFQLAHDRETAGRKWAARELGAHEAAVDGLRKAVLEDKALGVRIAAADSLARLKGDALLACAAVADARSRRAVLAGLGAWTGDAAVQETLRRAMETDASYACRSAAAISLGKSGATAYDAIHKVYTVSAEEPYVAPALLEGLFETKDARVVPELVKATAYGKHPGLRRRAVDLLGRRLKDQRDDDAFAALVKLLEDRAFHVRAATIAALGALGDRRAIEPLRKRVTTEFDARMARDAAEAIRKIESATSGPP